MLIKCLYKQSGKPVPFLDQPPHTHKRTDQSRKLVPLASDTRCNKEEQNKQWR